MANESDTYRDHRCRNDLGISSAGVMRLSRFENGASLFVDVSFALHAAKIELKATLYGEKGGVEVEPELTFVSEELDMILNMAPQISHRSFDFENAFQRAQWRMAPKG